MTHSMAVADTFVGTAPWPPRYLKPQQLDGCFFTSPTPFIPLSILYFSFSSPRRVLQNSMDYFDPNASHYPTSASGEFDANLDQILAPGHAAFDLGAPETSPYNWYLSGQQGYMSGSQNGLRPEGTFGKHNYNPVHGHGLTYIYISRVHVFGGLA